MDPVLLVLCCAAVTLYCFVRTVDIIAGWIRK